MILLYVSAFLLKTLCNTPCFEHLQKFVDIFKRLAELGCAPPCDLDALAGFASSCLSAKDCGIHGSGGWAGGLVDGCVVVAVGGWWMSTIYPIVLTNVV